MLQSQSTTYRPSIWMASNDKDHTFNDNAFANAEAFIKTLKPTILLVEDTDYLQRINTLFLQKMGCQVDIASNGRQAVKKAQKHQYHLILMDIGLPIMDGIEATRAIRRHEAITGQHIPIIALTAFGEPMREQCERAGVDGFAIKPLLYEQMTITLAQHLTPKR